MLPNVFVAGAQKSGTTTQRRNAKIALTAMIVPMPPAEMNVRATRSAVRTLLGVRRPLVRPV